MTSHTFFRSSTEIKEEKLKVESFRRKRGSLDKLFDSKNNSLTFLRLFLTILVIVSHSYLLGNFGHEPLHDWSYEKKILGNIAVDSFFALSGFLISEGVSSPPLAA